MRQIATKSLRSVRVFEEASSVRVVQIAWEQEMAVQMSERSSQGSIARQIVRATYHDREYRYRDLNASIVQLRYIHFVKLRHFTLFTEI